MSARTRTRPGGVPDADREPDHSIYKEIGPGKRVSLCKLAIDQLEQTGRPLRLAIDIAIWQFQVQAARGGANPAIRTLFYRLVRLLSLPIRPVFVFDGPNKPIFKRNKRSAGRGDGLATAMAKRLIHLFGFHVHNAPGEAEAECALLQRQGVVDAVLSEDVDTIMFGCTRTLRNWSAEGVKGSKTPTHVSLYETAALALDREGMVLVALMSGGDYLPEGVPGCGVKVACEAARGGMGKSLCRLRGSDASALASWRETLLHELRTNESGFFRTRHNALSIPEAFPNVDILRYYTHPVVSQSATIEVLRRDFCEERPRPVQVAALRDFVGETFDWGYRGGAVKLIRVLAPSLLAQKMLAAGGGNAAGDVGSVQEAEATIAHGVTTRRSHFSTDATPELRVSYTPANLVDGINLEDELVEEIPVYGRDGLALNDDEFDQEVVEDGGKSIGRKAWDPLEPDVVWIPEAIAKMGIPLTVGDWEEKQRVKQQARLDPKPPKGRAPKQKPAASQAAGQIGRYLKTTKVVAGGSNQGDPSFSKPRPLSPPFFPPKPSIAQAPKQQQPAAPRSKQPPQPATRKGKGDQAPPPRPQADNPWALASSQTRPRAPPAAAATPLLPAANAPREAIVISSSPHPPTSPRPGPPLKRQARRPLPTPDSDPFGSPLPNHPPSPPRRSRPPARATLSKSPAAAARRAPRGKDAAPCAQSSITAYGTLRERKTAVDGASSPPGKEAVASGFSSDDDVDLPVLSSLLTSARYSKRRAAAAAEDLSGDEGGEPGLPPSTEAAAAGDAGATWAFMAHGSDASDDPFGEAETLSREETGRNRMVAWRPSQGSIVDLTGED